MAPEPALPLDEGLSSSLLLEGVAPSGEAIASVVFGATFDISADGTCAPKGTFQLVEEPTWVKADVTSRFTKPRLLTRDMDLWAWKGATDLVVRGSVRSERPTKRLDVSLRATGSKTSIEQHLVITGDRRVERGSAGLILSEPLPFVEMPLTYDRAYGGTDEAAEARHGDEETLNFFAMHLEPDENEELSPYSYPRNPAGRGYLVDLEGAEGLAFPNIEFSDDRLTIESLARPLYEWGDRPYPAGFDWINHAWFPRSAYVAGLPPIHDDRLPARERRLGLFEDGWEEKSASERSVYPFANGAHPYLCRRQWVGDESIVVGHMAPDGGSLKVRLPGLLPTVSLKFPRGSSVRVAGTLTLVLVEAERRELTLVYRATHVLSTPFGARPPQPGGRPALPPDWFESTTYSIDW